MPERMTEIKMQAFRGVPGTLALELQDGRSCVVLGDNGTGKSSIADAIEWYFKGQVEFLKKEKRSDAIRNSGASGDLQTAVVIETDGSLGGSVTSDTPPHGRVLEIGGSELLILRGRTLAEFVDKTKGEKWHALAELLGLEAIDQLRLDLQYTRNVLETEARGRADELTTRRLSLGQLVEKVSEEGILATLREKCTAVGIQTPRSMAEAFTPEWIRTVVPGGSSDDRAAALKGMLTELEAMSEHSISLAPIDVWNRFVSEGKPDMLPLNLYRAADSLLGSTRGSDECPLCGQPVFLGELRQKIVAVLEELEGAERDLQRERQEIQACLDKLRAADERRSDIVRRAGGQDVELPQPPGSLHGEFGPNVEAFKALCRGAANRYQDDVAAWVASSILILDAALPAPETARGQILVDIGVLHAQALEWHSATCAWEEAVAASTLAARVFDRYQLRQRDYFDNIIQQISNRSAEIYRFLHRHEGVGDVKVETVGEKGIELSVDHFGKRELPPHRVLSESHMNSLGLSLFLAMAETFNEEIDFLVLDDVVNSFDRDHRGRLAELLVNEFDTKQLIVLTHDEQFYRRIRVLAPSWIDEHFTSWSYEDGPRTRQYKGDRFLVEAGEELGYGNRVGAAQKGRRALEEFLQEACEALQALLPFRRGQRNDERMADEVMSGLRRTLRDRAKPVYSELTPLLRSLEADLQAALNVESHASQGGTSNQEIQDALGRVGDLQARFTCETCGTRVWHRGTVDSSRCRCGEAVFPPPASSS